MDNTVTLILASNNSRIRTYEIKYAVLEDGDRMENQKVPLLHP
jgi:hypothetical protein